MGGGAIGYMTIGYMTIDYMTIGYMTIGLDYRHGLLAWTIALYYWLGRLAWTIGLQYRLVAHASHYISPGNVELGLGIVSFY